MANHLLLTESPLDQPADNREVLPLVVGRQNDRVLVLDRTHLDRLEREKVRSENKNEKSRPQSRPGHSNWMVESKSRRESGR